MGVGVRYGVGKGRVGRLGSVGVGLVLNDGEVGGALGNGRDCARTVLLSVELPKGVDGRRAWFYVEEPALQERGQGGGTVVLVPEVHDVEATVERQVIQGRVESLGPRRNHRQHVREEDDVEGPVDAELLLRIQLPGQPPCKGDALGAAGPV
jgi:hypothetical protein